MHVKGHCKLLLCAAKNYIAYDSEDNRNYCYNSFSFREIGFLRMSGYTDRGSNSIIFNQVFQLKTLVIKMKKRRWTWVNNWFPECNSATVLNI